MKESYSIPGCRVERVVRSGSTQTVLVVRTERRGAPCPSCKQHSDAQHSTYVRRPADVPSAGRAVQLELHVRRFSCRNARCERRTFAERLPRLLAPSARRTRRLARAQCAVGMTAGAEGGARLLKPLAMPTSPDTLLRLMHRAPLPAQIPPQAVGVDDWASRKGRTYGSILVDLKKHRVVDLLPDRSASTLAAWLRRHSGVEVIARDRSSEYARAVAEGAPHAQQVADRWHLLLNGRQMVERWLTGAHARLRALPEVPSADTAPVRRHASFPRTHSEARAREESRARRLAVYQAVRRRHMAGEPLLRISNTLRLARGTVRKYALATSFPERAARVPGPSILDPYLEYLVQRHTAGCENALALWREIRARGFKGTSRQVHRWLQTRRTTVAHSTPRIRRGNDSSPNLSPPGGALPSPKQLAWMCVQPKDALTPTEVTTLARIEQDTEAARVVTLVHRFGEIVRERSVTRGAKPINTCSTFEQWLGEARTCGVRAVETFAQGLEQDGDAVRAALTTPWSNAQSEGQITKLKLLKRQMYGRASFDLLRRRVLLAA
ncbi:ISL3 family transposase [Archangium violaceum]|uniref:ISL3 family transposase n=1 Tax=Archangium violaceum TaxID=83451 RepID=UPI00194F6C01|nr:ISL3 family transposase [Archangium violaceum]QRO01375.1 ISL3 family transposase [Archangium violaceum]